MTHKGVQVPAARAFLRWVGGKARQVHLLGPLLPEISKDEKYFEPFLGAGSLFFSLGYRAAILGDANRDLISCYAMIKAAPRGVSAFLAQLASNVTARSYAMARERFNALSRGPEKAALFIFLNRTCFNGIWRVSRTGKFNVPFGSLANPLFPMLEDLRAISRKLASARLVTADFEATLKTASAGDVVYLDPPYPPLNGTAYFTHYTKKRFDLVEHERVARVALELGNRGCKVLVSNADLPVIRSLYSDFQITELFSNRCVASHGRRYRVRDLVLSNFIPTLKVRSKSASRVARP